MIGLESGLNKCSVMCSGKNPRVTRAAIPAAEITENNRFFEYHYAQAE